MATPKEALQSLRILIESKFDAEAVKEFDAIAEPLKEHLRLVPDKRSYLKSQSEAFEKGVEELESNLVMIDYHPQSTGNWNPYEYALSQLKD